MERPRARTKRRNMPTKPTGEGASGAAEVRAPSVGKTLKIEPFKIPENHLEIGRAWQEWIEDFEEETAYFKITEVRDKVSALKIYGGLEVKRLARNLPDATPVEAKERTRQLFYSEEKQAPRQVHLQQTKASTRREFGELRGTSTRKGEGLRIRRPDQRTNTRAPNSHYHGRRSDKKEHPEEMGPRPIHRRSKPEGGYQPTSERHER